MNDVAPKTAIDYRDLLLRLLPRGGAWPRLTTTPLARLLQGCAVEFSRVHARVLRLLEEADPRTASETLAAWERNAGLDGTATSRNAALHAQLVARGGQSIAYFQELGRAFGKTITITEYKRTSLFCAGSKAGDPLRGTSWMFYWKVDGSDLQADLKALFERYRPAHTTIIWSS